MSAERKKAIRGAYQVAEGAVRGAAARLDRLAKSGVVVDAEQRAELSRIADALRRVAIGEAPETLELFTSKSEEKWK